MSDDDEERPFASLGDDREGDPFENLDPPADEGGEERLDEFWAGVDADRRPEEADEGTPDANADPFADADADAGASADVDADVGASADVDAGADLGERPDAVEGGAEIPDPTVEDPFADVETPEGDPFGTESAFERVDVGSVDPDEVWERMAAEGDEQSVPEESRYAEVSKHTHCEQCEFFSEPPDATCTHETAEIIEFLDMETVRLLNCPVVAERRQLERET